MSVEKRTRLTGIRRFLRWISHFFWLFIILLLINQAALFGFCLAPYCLLAATPHVSLITLVIMTWATKSGVWAQIVDGSEEGNASDNHGNQESRLRKRGVMTQIAEATQEFESIATELKENTERWRQEVEADISKREAVRERARVDHITKLKSEFKTEKVVMDQVVASRSLIQKSEKSDTEAKPTSVGEGLSTTASDQASCERSAHSLSHAAFITNSSLQRIVSKIAWTKDTEGSDPNLYKVTLNQIFSTRELIALTIYKEFCENPNSTLDKYVKLKSIPDRQNVVFQSGPPSYHCDRDCEFLHGDYFNLLIPFEIQARGEKEIDRFKDFCSEFRKEIMDDDPSVLLKLGARFILKNPPEKLRAANSGVAEPINNVDLAELEAQIDALFDEADAFRFKDNSTAKVIKDFTYAPDSVALKKAHDDPHRIWVEAFKIPLKERLRDYFRVKFSQDLVFEGMLLEQLGFKPCSVCAASILEEFNQKHRNSGPLE